MSTQTPAPQSVRVPTHGALVHASKVLFDAQSAAGPVAADHSPRVVGRRVQFETGITLREVAGEHRVYLHDPRPGGEDRAFEATHLRLPGEAMNSVDGHPHGGVEVAPNHVVIENATTRQIVGELPLFRGDGYILVDKTHGACNRSDEVMVGKHRSPMATHFFPYTGIVKGVKLVTSEATVGADGSISSRRRSPDGSEDRASLIRPFVGLGDIYQA